MNTATMMHVRHAVVAAGLAVGALAAVGGATASAAPVDPGAATVSISITPDGARIGSHPRTAVTPDTASAATQNWTAMGPASVTRPDGSCCFLPTNYVKVSDALLRADHNTHSTKLDVSQYGRGVDLFCWVDGVINDWENDGGFVWFWSHPWGSRYNGWMRADLIHWGSYPRPGHC